jgi:hypothetical protein
MKVTATFSNGKTISRNTTKPLAYAYKSVNIYQEFTGFATTKELALKAANQTGKNKPIEIEVVEVLVGA